MYRFGFRLWHDSGVSIQKPTFSRRRFLLAALGVTAAASLPTSLTGCTKLQRPTADRVVDAYHKLALRDLEFLTSAGGTGAGTTIEVRTAHRDRLAEEIKRSCGIHEDGSAPEECGPAESSGLPAPDTGATPLDVLADARSHQLIVDALTRKSDFTDAFEVELVTAIDGGLVLAMRNLGQSWPKLVPDAPKASDGQDLLSGCEEPLTQALKAEYGLIYSFGVVAPKLGNDLKTSALTSTDRHRLLRDRTVALFDAAGIAAPVADPAYVATDSSLDPATAPAEFASATEMNCADAWQKVAIAAKNPQMRLFALQSAGLAAAGSSIFAGAPEEPLPGLQASLG